MPDLEARMQRMQETIEALAKRLELQLGDHKGDGSSKDADVGYYSMFDPPAPSLEDICRLWPDYADAIKGKRKGTGTLLEEVEPTAIEDGVLHLEAPKQLHVDAISKAFGNALVEVDGHVWVKSIDRIEWSVARRSPQIPPSSLSVDADTFRSPSESLVIEVNEEVEGSWQRSAKNRKDNDKRPIGPIDVAVIFLLWRDTEITRPEIAGAYDLSKPVVYQISTGYNWSSVTDQIKSKHVTAQSLWDGSGFFNISVDSEK